MAGVERGEEESEFSLALEKSLESFVHKTLKDEQRECIRRIVVEKKDVLAVLPTGFGKSVIYQLIPSVLRNMRAGSECNTKTTVVVVSPLEYIRKQQVAVLEKLNCRISAAAIGDSTEIDNEIEEGRFDIVYGSAEQRFSDRWRCLQFGALHQTKVLVVDEVHTVATW